jgi:hypothetical protein
VTHVDPAQAPQLSGLTLVKLPADATTSALATAPPLGTYAEVTALLAELLPGSTMDDGGRLTFRRQDYAIEIWMAQGDPVPSATLTLVGQPSIVAIRRLLRRTGWRVYDSARGEFISGETLGTALARSAPSGLPVALRAPVEMELSHGGGWEATAEAARHYGRPLAGLIVMIVLSGMFWWMTRRDPIDVNERQVIFELDIASRANLMLRGATGTYTTVEELANPAHQDKLQNMLLPPAFRTPVRHGYRFEFRGDPFDPAKSRGQAFVLIEPAYSDYIYVAVPVEPGVTGRRSFAYYSQQGVIYAREGFAMPTTSDQIVPTR